jgi:hypothetical protein
MLKQRKGILSVSMKYFTTVESAIVKVSIDVESKHVRCNISPSFCRTKSHTFTARNCQNRQKIVCPKHNLYWVMQPLAHLSKCAGFLNTSFTTNVCRVTHLSEYRGLCNVTLSTSFKMCWFP